MLYLVYNKWGLGVSNGAGSFTPIEEASKQHPTEIKELLARGKVDDCDIINDRCYVGDKTFKFIINTGVSYPDEYVMQYVKEVAAKYGGEFVDKQFGDLTFVTYDEKCFEDLFKSTSTTNPDWTVVKSSSTEPEEMATLPTPSEAVLDEKAIMESDGFDMDSMMEMVSNSFEDEVEEDSVNEEEAAVEDNAEECEVKVEEEIVGEVDNLYSEEPHRETVVGRTIDAMLAPYTRTVVPVDCRGETYAFTYNYTTLDEVTDVAFCIENNFERRGDYWILDVIQRGMRIIFSEKNQYKHEFRIDDCL